MTKQFLCKLKLLAASKGHAAIMSMSLRAKNISMSLCEWKTS